MRNWMVTVNFSEPVDPPPGPGVHTFCSLLRKVVRLRVLYEPSTDVKCRSARLGDCVSCKPIETQIVRTARRQTCIVAALL